MASSRSLVSRQAMPQFVSPMLAVLSDFPEDEEQFAYEFKWDGYRATAYIQNGTIKLKSRNDIEMTATYPELRPLGAALKKHAVILDGEIVALDKQKRPSFSLLQNRTGVFGGGPAAPSLIVYMIFDLLFLDGQLLYRVPYLERRQKLLDLNLSGPNWQVPMHQIGDGRSMFEVSKAHHFEGLVAKRIDSLYRPGDRSGDWLKIKITQRQEFVVAGWLEGEGVLAGGVRALILAVYEKTNGRPKLEYVGNVGTGFNLDQREKLLRALRKIEVKQNPFKERIPGPVHFTTPSLVVEVEFRGWTGYNKIRQGAFKGIRTDKKPTDVIRENRT